MIYLDAAATTKPKQEVIDAMLPYLTEYWENPSSLYAPSVQIKRNLDKARGIIREFINAGESDDIVFTSGGSEANCAAICGFLTWCRSNGKTPSVITTVIEHKSIQLCVEKTVDDLHFVGVDEFGFVKQSELEKILRSIPRQNAVLVSIQYANNEIGTIQNIKELAELTHDYGGIFHTDAVQAFGSEPIDVQAEDIDLMSVSGHKLGAPKGIGFLYKRFGIGIEPLIFGTQENGLRGGTENVPYIVGLAKAVALRYEDSAYNLRMSILRDDLLTELKAMGCTLNGHPVRRLANNINVTFHGATVTGEALIYLLDAAGIKISAGSACNSYSVMPSHVLTAIGMSPASAAKTIRISLPSDFQADDIEIIIDEFQKAIRLLSMDGEETKAPV